MKNIYPQYSPEIMAKVANGPACLWSFEHDVQVKLVRSGLHLQVVVVGSSVEDLSVHFSEVAWLILGSGDQLVENILKNINMQFRSIVVFNGTFVLTL